MIFGFGGMVIGQFLAYLDIQIVNASLGQIQAGVSASSDEISWVQSAYLIAEVVMIPLSSYLARWWGTQRLFMISCAGFTLMSALTGLATDIDTMIITRALQGFIGGAMIPTVFAVAFSAFPPERRLLSSVIMSTVISMAPTIGPTLGGHLTEWLSWRWLFFINIPLGLLVLFLVGRFGDFDQPDPRLARNFDWTALVCMAAFLMCGQYVLEEGTKEQWFQSDVILGLTLVSLGSGCVFIWRALASSNPIVQLQAFGDRNFRVGCFLTFISGIGLFGSTYLLPLFLGRVRGDSPSQIGVTMVVSGMVMFIMGPISTRLAQIVPPRPQIIAGFLIAAAGMWVSRGVTSDWSFNEYLVLQITRSGGLALAMFTTQNITMGTLAPDMVKSAGALVNLSRNVGGAFALAILTSLLGHQTAQHMGDLSSSFTVMQSAGSDMLQGLSEHMQDFGVAQPDEAARKMMSGMLRRKALVMAFSDCYTLLCLGFILAALASLAAKPTRLGDGPPVPGAALGPVKAD
jgi:DHA2 family multidrug resistance protein